MKPQGFVPPSASPSAHEAADLNVPLILRVAAILGVTIVASILVLGLFFQHMEHKYGRRTSEAAPAVLHSELPPLPRVQEYPALDLQAVRALEDSHLNRYGWIDRPHGVAQIPVDRAMVLWVKSYSPTPAPSSLSAKSASPSTQDASVSGTNELQMRRQKAQESAHAP